MNQLPSKGILFSNRVISELTVETMDEFKKMFKMFDKVGSSIQQSLDMGDE